MKKLLLLFVIGLSYSNFGYAQSWSVPGTVVAGGNGFGSANNQTGNISDIYVAANGDVYVSDQTYNRVQKWTPGAIEGVVVAGGNGQGAAANQLSVPVGIWVDEAESKIYVVDALNARVQMWAAGATTGVTVAGGNGWGSNLNQLYFPGGIFKKGNDLYIYDGAARIVKWTLGATQGIVVAGGNDFGTAPNQLAAPDGTGFIYVDDSNNVYATEYSGDRVSKWAPGATTGIIVADIAATGSTNVRVSGIDFLNDGKMLLTYAAQGYSRVALWDNGVFVREAVATSSGELVIPIAVRADANNNIYVADANYRVKKFTPKATIEVTTVSGGAAQIPVGGTIALKATLTPATFSQKVTWMVQVGAQYGSVSSNGVVSGTAPGAIIVRASSTVDTSIYADYTVTVTTCTVSAVTETKVSTCKGSPVTLTATSSETGGIISWYTAANATTAIATGTEYTISNVTETTSYWVQVSVPGGCTSAKVEVVVTANEVPGAPEAEATQYFEAGDTLADLDVATTGTLTWYTDVALTTVLPPSTALVAGTTYYVTQIINTCQSVAKAIKVEAALGVANISSQSFKLYPNPTNDLVTIQSNANVSNITVFNVVGQVVTTVASKTVDLSKYSSGMYIFEITFENGKAVSQKVVKK